MRAHRADRSRWRDVASSVVVVAVNDSLLHRIPIVRSI